MYKGKPTIMDSRKQINLKKREWIDDYFMQGAAHALAHNELYETKIERIAISRVVKNGNYLKLKKKSLRLGNKVGVKAPRIL